MTEPEPATTRTQDIEALEIDARRALVRDRPGQDALWGALLKPRNAVLRRYAEAQLWMALSTGEGAQRAAVALQDANGEPLAGQLGRLLDRVPLEGGPPSLISVAEAMVARAILGDVGAAEAIWNRIEGKVGTRKDDLDSDIVNRRGEMVAAIEATVRLMQAQPGDDARNITPERDKPAANGAGVTDVEVENMVRRFYEEDDPTKKPNGKPPPEPPKKGNGFKD